MRAAVPMTASARGWLTAVLKERVPGTDITPMVSGESTIPLSYFFTLETSSACRSGDMFL